MLTEYQSGWYIEEIDASRSLLIYEGMQNMRNLMYIKKLDISYSAMVDAWCLDRLTGEYEDSLEYLDLSGCKALNWNGLECVWRLRRLKVLVLQDMEHIKDLDLLCLMLLEILPDLQIKRVDYMANAKVLLAGSEAEPLLEDLDKSMLLLTDGLDTDGISKKSDILMQTKDDSTTQKQLINKDKILMGINNPSHDINGLQTNVKL